MGAAKKEISQTTRQNLCQMRGSAYRRLARAVLTLLRGEDAATPQNVRILAKSKEFQEMVGQALKSRWADNET